MMPLTPVVKWIVIINAVLWVLGVLILQQTFGINLYEHLGLIPNDFIFKFKIWQPFTYQFLHAEEMFHFLFNMFAVWMIGTELENLWGKKFFTFYYIACGFGAGILYSIILLACTFIFPDSAHVTQAFSHSPVIGASGAVFGLLIAYGLLLGEKTIYFYFVFPMKAKYFVALLGLMEIIQLYFQKLESRTSNLAHICGLLIGFLIIFGETYRRKVKKRKGEEFIKARKSHLKLVVDNDNNDTYH